MPVAAVYDPNMRMPAIYLDLGPFGVATFSDVSNVTFGVDSPTTTPEPVSFALLGLGMMALGGWRRSLVSLDTSLPPADLSRFFCQ